MKTKHAQRAAFERRTWRLALLLTGDAWGASRTLDGVARTVGDLSKIDAVRLDRMIVTQARDVASLPAKKRGVSDDEPLPPDGPVAETFKVLRQMKPQPREAWVLSHVDELDEIHVARAMDASKTASGHHRMAAEALLEERLGDDAGAGIEGLRTWTDEIDPEPWLVIHRERVKRKRKITWMVIGVVVVLVVVGGLVVALSV